MMKPDLRTLRPLSDTFLPDLPPISPDSSGAPRNPRRTGIRVTVPVLIVSGLILAGSPGFGQQPSPIPSWPDGAPGTSANQYAPNQYPQQPQYQQPPAYGQQPAYGPQYGQPQYQQPPAYGQQPGYGEQYAPPQQAYASPDLGYNAPYQPSRALSPDQLEQIVAPIALYPDNLVSMVLAASTYPAEVSAADQWLHMQGNAPPDQIAAGANAQTTWDPSVKALTAFPQVLDQLAENLQWTTDLGNAYYNQPQDVMQTIQVMRSRAQSAGNLQTTPQEVVTEDQGNIEIAPPTPDVVYVPAYNPWAAYGAPVDPYPGYSVLGAIGSFIGNAFLHFGPGIAMNAFSATPFGWLGWGLDWLAHAIFFNHDVWSTNGSQVRDWGFAHGGARYWGAHGEMAAFRARGWEPHALRSGLDRGNWGSGRHITPTPRFSGGNQGYGNRGGENYGRSYQNGGEAWARNNGPYGQNGRGAGFGYGSNGAYGQQNYRGPQATGRPQGYGGGSQDGRSLGYTPSYGRTQQLAGDRTPEFRGGPQFGGNRTPSYNNGYDRQSFGSGAYSRPFQNYGGSSYGQAYRSPGYGGGSRAYNYGYSGQNNYARGSSGGGFFGGGRSKDNFGGGESYKAPKAPKSSGFGGHSWGGGGYKAPKAPKEPHFSGGGGHFHGGGGGHSGGGRGGKHH